MLYTLPNLEQGHGANWCNGDCHWSEETCVLKTVSPAATRCGPRSSQPTVSSWSSMGHRVRMKFNTVSGSGGSSGSHQRKFVVHVNASLEECGGHFQGTQGVITRSGILNSNRAIFPVCVRFTALQGPVIPFTPKKVYVSLHLLSVTPTFDPRQRKSLKSNVRNYSKYVYDNNAILILSIDKVSYGVLAP